MSTQIVLKQAYYGSSLLNATYVKIGNRIIAKIFPPHNQVDRFSILITQYPREPIKTFYGSSLEESLEFVRKYYE